MKRDKLVSFTKEWLDCNLEADKWNKADIEEAADIMSDFLVLIGEKLEPEECALCQGKGYLD